MICLRSWCLLGMGLIASNRQQRGQYNTNSKEWWWVRCDILAKHQRGSVVCVVLVSKDVRGTWMRLRWATLNTKYPNLTQLGFVRVGCRPQRVSESKGQPSVVIGLPQLASNYRAGLGFYVLCVGTCVSERCVCVWIICSISGCWLHNPLIRCINSGLSTPIHTDSHMFAYILLWGPTWNLKL